MAPPTDLLRAAIEADEAAAVVAEEANGAGVAVVVAEAEEDPSGSEEVCGCFGAFRELL